jgi:hypothetical protein
VLGLAHDRNEWRSNNESKGQTGREGDGPAYSIQAPSHRRRPRSRSCRGQSAGGADFGYEVREAVAYIDVGSPGPGALTSDGKMILHSQGATYGPIFSKEISLAAAEFQDSLFADGTPPPIEGNNRREFFCGILNAARTAGADIKKWFRIRAFGAVAGCVAEANFSKRDFGELFFQDVSAESDRGGILYDARMAAILTSEITPIVCHMATVSAYLMQDDKIWTAVLALAQKLPVMGRMPCGEVVKIITGILSPNDLAAAYSEAVKEIDKLKAVMEAQPIVAVICGDQTILVKGRDHLPDGESVAALQFECKLPVFAETLQYAFGDASPLLRATD